MEKAISPTHRRGLLCKETIRWQQRANDRQTVQVPKLERAGWDGALFYAEGSPQGRGRLYMTCHNALISGGDFILVIEDEPSAEVKATSKLQRTTPFARYFAMALMS